MSNARNNAEREKHKVEVINHERYIDGITVDEWLEKMKSDGNWAAICDLAMLGKRIVEKGVDSPQKFVKELYRARNN